MSALMKQKQTSTSPFVVRVFTEYIFDVSSLKKKNSWRYYYQIPSTEILHHGFTPPMQTKLPVYNKLHFITQTKINLKWHTWQNQNESSLHLEREGGLSLKKVHLDFSWESRDSHGPSESQERTRTAGLEYKYYSVELKVKFVHIMRHPLIAKEWMVNEIVSSARVSDAVIDPHQHAISWWYEKLQQMLATIRQRRWKTSLPEDMN